MQINKPIVRDLRGILDNVLNDNERLEQFDVEVGSARFTDTEVTFKLSVKVKGSKPKDERDLEDYISMLGANIDKDRIVKYRDMDLKLVGYKRVNRKYPFILQDIATSKRYKFPTDWVNANFSIEEMVS